MIRYNGAGGVAELLLKDENQQRIGFWKWNLGDKKHGREIWMLLGRKYGYISDVPSSEITDSKSSDWIDSNNF